MALVPKEFYMTSQGSTSNSHEAMTINTHQPNFCIMSSFFLTAVIYQRCLFGTEAGRALRVNSSVSFSQFNPQFKIAN